MTEVGKDEVDEGKTQLSSEAVHESPVDTVAHESPVDTMAHPTSISVSSDEAVENWEDIVKEEAPSNDVSAFVLIS